MHNKRQLHHLWTYLRRVKPSYFLIVAVISAVVCIISLRSNNQQMVKLRTAVYTADMNNTDVQGALSDLQAYVTAHMNTDLSSGNNAVYPPIQLKYTYDRLLQSQTSNLISNGSQQLVPDDLYKFDFLSPKWSPDTAGWSMVASIIGVAGYIIGIIVNV